MGTGAFSIRRIAFFFFIVALLLIGSFYSLVSTTRQASAVAGINETINFQGRLFNGQGAIVPDGFYNVQFQIYQDGTGTAAGNPGGTLLWTESHLNNAGNGITVRNGYMAVELGSIVPFASLIDWNQDTLWLSINIGNTNLTCTPFSSCSPDGEMLPMKRFTSTPYSLNSGRLAGLTSAQFIQLAQGVQEDVSTNTSSIFVNKTGTGNLVQLQSGGADAFVIENGGNLILGSNANRTVSVAEAPIGIAGRSLTIGAGNGSSDGLGTAGGDLVLQGGNALGTGDNNGGNITISGGTATGTGTKGLVNLSASSFVTNTETTCLVDCTISQAGVDNFGAVIVNAGAAGLTLTLPDPSNTAAAGRIIYITTASGSFDYNLSTNTGLDIITIAMRQNTTATMIWNGTDWTPGGASNATTLQAVYVNGTNPTTTPEIKLDTIRGTIDIQDADISIGENLLNVRASNSLGLGTVLFGVSNNGRVTIQGTTDDESAFGVLDQDSNYLYNINSANNYVISNAIRTPGNEIVNPGLESGGTTTNGAEGWFGPAQSSIDEVAANARTGNNSMAVTANSTDLHIFAGTYYEVVPGEILYLSAFVKNSAGANGEGGVKIVWYDKDRIEIGVANGFPDLPGTTYVPRVLNEVVPSGAAFVRVGATVRSTATTGSYHFDDFYMKKGSESANYTFRNAVNGSDAFRIQSAGSSQTLFRADTENNIVQVGDSTGSDTDTTLLVVDSATADPTTSLASKNGGIFYRSDNNTLKAVIGGAVVEICTTSITCSGYAASASSSIQLQLTTPGSAQTGNFNITGVGILTQLQTQDRSGASINSDNLVIRTGNATGTTSNSGNITIDVGTATGTTGTITIGRAGVETTMGGTLDIQGADALALGLASTNSGSILFYNSAGGNTITLSAPGSNPTASYNLVLPQNPGAAGDCLKDSSGSGTLTFGNCAAGITVNLQDVYNNSSAPATITLADNKNFRIIGQDTSTDSNVVFDLQCVTSCGANNGQFAVQNSGTNVFVVRPNNEGIILGIKTQVGSGTTDGVQTNFQLDSFNGFTESESCTETLNQGAMYYNTALGSIRSCINGTWSDLSNPDTLGLLSFGIVPSSGGSPFDLAAQTTAGASGPCRVSYVSASRVAVQPCVAYSGGKRVNVEFIELVTNSASAPDTSLTTVNRWGHICLTGTGGQPAFTSTAGLAAETNGMPTFSLEAPVVCLASIQGENATAGRIDNMYDVRPFTSTLKEAVTASTAVSLGMLTDSGGTGGAMRPAVSGSDRLYGVVVATNGATSTTAPNVIVTNVGPSWVKATAGTAGQFIRTSGTNGYGDTIAAIPNNSFYYSAGNTRSTYSTTCTTAANCNGSLYVYFNVR